MTNQKPKILYSKAQPIQKRTVLSYIVDENGRERAEREARFIREYLIAIGKTFPALRAEPTTSYKIVFETDDQDLIMRARAAMSAFDKKAAGLRSFDDSDLEDIDSEYGKELLRIERQARLNQIAE
jgi:hypothetical protein